MSALKIGNSVIAKTTEPPVLFLDVDGVLNSYEWFASQPPTAVTEVDPRAVRRINRIVETSNCRIVLSSSWRHDRELVEKLQALFPIHDKTPRLTEEYAHRGREIEAWLTAHPEVTVFAIIDDDSDAGMLYGDRFVRTHPRRGMYGKHEKAVLALLSDGQEGTK